MKRTVVIFIVLFCLGIMLQAIDGKWQAYTDVRSDILYFEDGDVYVWNSQGNVLAGRYWIYDERILVFTVYENEYFSTYCPDGLLFNGVASIIFYHAIGSETRRITVPVRFSLWKLNE